MNEKFQKPPWKTTTAIRDLVLISAIFILVSVLVYVFGAFEIFQEWIRKQPQWEEWHIHDYLFVFVILAFALGVFSLRRWIELKREIAGRKRAKAALRESEERFRSVARSATDAIIVANRKGNIISWNTAAQTIFGYGEEEALGKPVSLLMPERFHDSHRRGLERFLSTGESRVTGKTVEFAGRKKDGSEFPLELSLANWKTGEETFFTGTIRDITERKQVEAALRQSEEKYRALVETTATGFLIVDAHGRVVDANAEYVRLTGHDTLAEIAGRSVVEWTAPHDLARNAAEVKQCTERGWTRNLEIDYVNRRGEITPIEVNATVVGSGEAVRILALCRDITARKRATEALRESEERWRILFNESADGLIVANPATQTFRSVNQAMCRMLGYSQAELLKLGVTDIHPPADLPAALDAFPRHARHGELKTASALPMLRKDGSVFYADVGGTMVVVAGEHLLLGAFRDVTERQRLQQERERLITELQQALADVKHLSGLLPICASCKKIRDDHGYWSQVEIFIAEHSEAQFTHGICPACIEKYFPDLTPEDLDTNS